MRRQVDGTLHLVKVLETGSLAEAEAEGSLSRWLKIDGVLRIRSGGTDASTGRPCVVSDYHEGIDLMRFLHRHGPLTPRAVARVTVELATTLQRLHRVPRPDGGIGMLHRDVKPSNVMLLGQGPDPERSPVLLIDLEHLWPIGGSQRNGAFTGGTIGFAPPEAHRQGIPSPAFDVFGLGVTMHLLATGRAPFDGPDETAITSTLLRGRRPRRELARLPDALVALIDRCLAADPNARPTLDEVIADARHFLAHQDDADRRLDAVLPALFAGEADAAAATLNSLHPTSDRAERLASAIVHVRRLRHRIAPPTPRELDAARASGDLAEPARFIARRTPALAAYLRRFPGDPAARRTADAFAVAGTRLLGDIAVTVTQLREAGRFETGEAMLIATIDAVRTWTHAFGALPIPADVVQHQPSPLLRDPIHYLTLMLNGLRAAATEHAAIVERMKVAESMLDLGGIASAVRDAAERHGGPSEIVAALKDREHRLRFYVERLVHARGRLDDLRQQMAANGVEVDLEPFVELVETCERQRGDSTDATTAEASARRSIGMRTALRTLQDLLREFPHTEGGVGPAERSLAVALAAVTGVCWRLVEQAQRSLAAQPIPIRPLQALLNRIDGCRLAEAFVDVADRSREDLVDEIEVVRLKVEKARTTRDRIARGAQAAIDRGHLTTALYEMSRAVDRFTHDGDESTGTSRQLVEQLEETRARKREVDHAAARNQELAARIAELQDDPASATSERIKALEDRRDVLEYLLRNVSSERRADYAQDLREVEVGLLKERVDRSESEFAATVDPRRRLEIARTAIELIRRNTLEPSSSRGPIGRVQRILEHWRVLADRTSAEIEAEAARIRDAERVRRRARTMRLAKIGVVLVALFGVYEVSLAHSRIDTLREIAGLLRDEAGPAPEIRRTASGVAFDRESALRTVDRFAARLARHGEQGQIPASLAEDWQAAAIAAQGLAASARAFDAGKPPVDLTAWGDGLLTARRAFDRCNGAIRAQLASSQQELADALEAHARHAHGVALAAATAAMLRADEANRAKLRQIVTASQEPMFALPAELLAAIASVLDS